MEEANRQQWIKLHQNKRYRPKYPSETVVQFVFRNFERNGENKVLDLGCGAGRHVFFLGNENIIPYGVDFSDEGIQFTRDTLISYGMEQFAQNMSVASLTDLPYESQFFDGIICYGVLYYLNTLNIQKAVREMERVLKPGGKLLLVVRTIRDYRFNKKSEVSGERNTIWIQEEDENRCAHSENGMLMHFFEEEELRNLFAKFKKISIDVIEETHDDQQFYDSNYILMAER
ncbi:MAG: class I SAM-dependent methyltransferase [Lachnospiraceae bacterium]|nr:class I SAM-dependent methyltransferase [Lachnospiraceae bacterium]